MKEYVFTIAARDPGCPLVEVPILRSGHDAANPAGLIVAMEAMVGLLKLRRTPEAVAKFIRDNAAVAMANNLILGRQ